MLKHFQTFISRIILLIFSFVTEFNFWLVILKIQIFSHLHNWSMSIQSFTNLLIQIIFLSARVYMKHIGEYRYNLEREVVEPRRLSWTHRLDIHTDNKLSQARLSRPIIVPARHATFPRKVFYCLIIATCCI